MKISYNWLKDYIQTNLSSDQMAEILTDIGLEIEGVEEFSSIPGGLEGFVTGEVLTCEKHPNADKLSITTVEVGKEKPLDIVCGAPNVKAGQKVIVALVGTEVQGPNNESFTIKKAKIRGEVSEGMICAEDELGIGQSHDGILVLENEVTPGIPASKYFKVEKDIVFEIGLTPNRIDAASHIGVARDLAAYLSQENETRVKRPGTDQFKVDDNSLPIPVNVEDQEACPRYAGVSIANVNVKESPGWLKNRLSAIGLKPINNIVDITNYVLHETGQPLHAFDAGKLEGKKIIVKKAPAGNSFTTLDKTEHKLANDDLMICDAIKPVAMAGIFGGMESGVTDSTRDIFLESAYFNPVSVRKTAKRHGLSTDSSFRFERGVDPNNTIYALKRAANLIKELAGGTISSEVVDIYPERIKDFEVNLSFFNLNRLIGKDIGLDRVKKILKALDIEITGEHERGLELVVPAYRVDVQREADVIEEILRIYGYNNVEISNTVKSTLNYAPKPDPEKIQDQVINYLVSNGFHEIWTNSLSKSGYYEETGQQKLVKILNPLSSDLDCMRQNLLFGGLECIVHNKNRQQQNLALFEFGNLYFSKGDHLLKGKADNYHEEFHLALFMAGNATEPNWINGDEESSYFHLKAIVDNLLVKLGLRGQKIKQSTIQDGFFTGGLELTINNKQLVKIGVVEQKVCKRFDIDDPVFYADIHWTNLLQLIKPGEVSYKVLPKYPEVRRDLALLLDKKASFKEIEEIARNTERNLLKNISLFDVYEGKGIEEGKKSYAVSFYLQDESKTLTDKHIDKIMEKLARAFEKQLNAQIRR